MTNQDKFEYISNFDHTNNILPYNEDAQKINDKMNIINHKNDEIISSSINEIKNNENINYKNLIKNHPLFPVLVVCLIHF